MNQRDLTITVPHVPGETPLDRGWGVFERTDGIAVSWSSWLRSVWSDEQAAEQEADRLNNTEGALDYEVSYDPESNVWSQRWFDTGRVTLTHTEVQLVLTYERADD